MRDRKSIQLSDDARKSAIASIRQYFAKELSQDIGDLKAALVLDYVLEEIGPSIYNAAIGDAKAFFDERTADLAALTTRDEFPFWADKARRTKPQGGKS
jgi:uncharacterized protein (DUF2164 family)